MRERAVVGTVHAHDIDIDRRVHVRMHVHAHGRGYRGRYRRRSFYRFPRCRPDIDSHIVRQQSTARLPEMLSQTDKVVLLAAFLTGSAATLVPKILLRTPCDASCGVDNEGAPVALNAPVYASSLVFAASCLGLAIEAATAARRRLSSEEDAISMTAWWAAARSRALKLVYPAVLNVFGLFLQLLALMFISAAVLAGLRGALILAMAMLGMWLGLKDAPKSQSEWHCIYASAAGAVLVGAGSELQAAFAPGTANGDAGGESSGGSPLGGSTAAAVGIGTAASLLGYVFATGQVALEQILLDAKPAPSVKATDVEESLLQDGIKKAPSPVVPAVVAFTKWQILGIEGVYGLAICGVALGILASTGGAKGLPIDDPAHTACCLRTTPSLWALSAAYGLLSLSFNACLLGLGASVGPSFRVFVFTARGLLTWGVEVALLYVGRRTDYGEGLSAFSLLVLGGYALLIGSGLWRVRLQQGASGTEKAQARMLEASAVEDDPEGEPSTVKLGFSHVIATPSPSHIGEDTISEPLLALTLDPDHKLKR